MFTSLNPFRLLETRSGVQIYPSPVDAALQRRSSLSIFQQCSRIRSCLLSDPTFARYLDYCAERPEFDPSDAVSHIWDCFALGISLCYLYNCLANHSSPALVPLTVSTDLSMLQASAESNRVKKHAIYLFAIEVRKLNPEWASLTVSDLMNDRVSLDGFMKVMTSSKCPIHCSCLQVSLRCGRHS
jgi:cell division control protein 24